MKVTAFQTLFKDKNGNKGHPQVTGMVPRALALRPSWRVWVTSQPFLSACLFLLHASRTPLSSLKTVHKRSPSRGGWALPGQHRPHGSPGQLESGGVTGHMTPQPMARPLCGVVSRTLPEGAGFQEKKTNLVHEGLG